MDSLDAQCLMIDLTTSEGARAPDQWMHLADGTLAYRFGESANSFSWPPHTVAEMATRWRGEARAVPERIAGLVAGHTAFAAMLDSGDLSRPDRIVHDLEADELKAFWDDEKLVVVVDSE